jgi:DNA-binding NarL/FixJ family response regulator
MPGRCCWERMLSILYDIFDSKIVGRPLQGDEFSGVTEDRSIRKVNSGEIWLNSHTTAAVMRHFSTGLEGSGCAQGGTGGERSPLSIREREIVKGVAQGYKNKEMAEKMFISEQTVKNHLHNIFDKVGVSDRLELALYAIHNGLHLVASNHF